MIEDPRNWPDRTRAFAVRALELIQCRDDALAPEPDWLLCTLKDGHEGDHRAQGEKGTTLVQWPRSRGRSAGELRHALGLRPAQ